MLEKNYPLSDLNTPCQVTRSDRNTITIPVAMNDIVHVHVSAKFVFLFCLAIYLMLAIRQCA